MNNDLDCIQAKWIKLFDELASDFRVDFDQIAAPFLSIPPSALQSILYVGKATAKDWYKDESNPDWALHLGCNASMSEKILERRGCTEEFIQNEAPNYRSGFWSFARDLNARAADLWRQPLLSPLQHIVWTNVFKIGVLKGNPESELREKQRMLAVETLRLEITVYRPQLVYFATGDYAADIIGSVVNDPFHVSWSKERECEGFWWRQATEELPAVVWTYHPQGKTRGRREIWISEACRLLPGKQED